jgi:hypothetical protein
VAHLQKTQICRGSCRAKEKELQRWCASRRASRRGSWLPRAGGGARGRRWRSGKEEGDARAGALSSPSGRRHRRTSRGWRSSELAVGSPPPHELGVEELRARRRAAAARIEGGARAGATEVKSSSWIWAEEGGGDRGKSRRPDLGAREGVALTGAPSSDLPLPPPGRQRARTPPENGRGSGGAEAVAEAAPAPPLRHGGLHAGPAPPPARICADGTGRRGRVEKLRRGGGLAGHGGVREGGERVQEGRERAETVGLQVSQEWATGEVDCILQIVLQQLLECVQ